MSVCRRFPTDDEVEAWLHEHCSEERMAATSVHERDQVMAAAGETNSIMNRVVPYSVAKGDARWGLAGRPSQEIARLAVRMYLVAESIGIRRLCPHVGTPRPLMVMCDPPVVFCVDCLARVPNVEPLFPSQCDSCGYMTALMAEMTVSIGPLLVSGNICPTCADAHQRIALSEADEVMQVGRNHPCICGSGKKFKHCCL